LGCCNLIRADVQAAHATGTPYALGSLVRIETTAATNLEDALTAVKPQRFQHCAPADDHIVTLGQGALQPCHLLSER
jgi:hypothetical protein